MDSLTMFSVHDRAECFGIMREISKERNVQWVVIAHISQRTGLNADFRGMAFNNSDLCLDVTSRTDLTVTKDRFDNVENGTVLKM